MNVRKITLTLTMLLAVPGLLLAQDEQGAAPPASNEIPASSEAESSEAESGDAADAYELENRKAARDQVNREIGAIEAKARRTEVVQEKMEEFRKVVTEEMIAEAPEMEEKIHRQVALVDELTSETGEPPDEDDPVQQEKLVELENLRNELGPVEGRVQELPSVKQARETFYTTLVVEMENIDSRTQSLIEKHRQLSREIAEIEERS